MIDTKDLGYFIEGLSPALPLIYVIFPEEGRAWFRGYPATLRYYIGCG